MLRSRSSSTEQFRVMKGEHVHQIHQTCAEIQLFPGDPKNWRAPGT